MYVGEDNNKIRNIVGGQLGELRRLYGPVLTAMSDYAVVDQATGQGMQDTAPPAKYYHLSMLPMKLQVPLLLCHPIVVLSS